MRWNCDEVLTLQSLIGDNVLKVVLDKACTFVQQVIPNIQ